MTLIEAITDVLGVFPPEYEFLLYAASIVFFVIFMYWLFGTISRVLLDYILGRKH